MESSPYALYDAARFIHEHPELIFREGGSGLLRVSPRRLAERHADAIHRLKPELLRFASRGWSQIMAVQVRDQAQARVSAGLTPKTVEVIQFMQCEQPETWEEVLRVQQRVDARLRAADWNGFMDALILREKLFAKGRTEWRKQEGPLRAKEERASKYREVA